MNSSEATGSSAMIDVLIERINVWLTARFAAWLYVIVLVEVSFAVLSRTLSKTTTVSYSEKPRIVSKAITVAGVTSKPTSEYTPAVMTRSWMRASMAANAILGSNRSEM